MPDISTWVQRFQMVHGNTYDYSAMERPQGNANNRITIICSVHGKFKQSPYNHAKGHGCDKCAGEHRGSKSRKTIEKFIAQAKAFHGDKFTYEKVKYISSRTKVIVTCRQHGDFEVSPHNLIRKKSCPGCASESRGKYEGQQEMSQRTAKARIEKSRASIIPEARKVHGDTYAYDLDSYVSARVPMTITCSEHGPFKMTRGHHIKRGHRCPVCAKSVSAVEYSVRKFIETLNTPVEYRNRKLLDGREIDIYFPEQKVGIEINGLYWHRDEANKKWSLRKKWEEAQERGLRLIHIFEDEWKDKPLIVQDLIKAALGLRETLMARKTEVTQLSVAEARQFLESWHIQGYAGCQLRYGLKLGNQLVSVLTLGKPRFSREDWEIIRFASSHHIPGGFNKLFKAFISEHGPQEVITFADLRIGTGQVYAKAGFTFEGITTPDYWWAKGQKSRIPRYQTQKAKLSEHPIFSPYYKEELSESAICQAAGYFKVSGVGQAKFIYSQA